MDIRLLANKPLQTCYLAEPPFDTSRVRGYACVCSPELVAGAEFDGILEIPMIEPPDEIVIPSGITPFTKREHAVGTDDAIGFFEKDPKFAEVLISPAAYVDDFLRFRYLLPVDCSLYRDAPLAVQVTNLYWCC